MISRRGLLRALLAAPAIIRTPGLLMPVKIPSLLVTAEETYAIGLDHWRALLGSDPGEMNGFCLDDVPLAMKRMAELRRLQAEISRSFHNASIG